MDRDAELLKIQLIADYHQTTFTAYTSLFFSYFIGWVLVTFTLLFEEIFTFAFSIGFIAFGFIWFSAILFYLLRDYHKNLDGIGKLIEHVNKGEPLPSLKELRKRKF